MGGRHDVAVAERGCDPEKRQRILAGARHVFFSYGFDGASMDAIARAASVSKGTLYVYFENKNTLFYELIADMKKGLPEALFEMSEGGDLERQLHHIAHSLVERLMSAEHLALIRTVIGAVEKFPEIGATLFEAGFIRGSKRLADFFAEQVAKGRLLPGEDPMEMAGVFLDVTSAGVLRWALLCNPVAVGEDRIERAIHRGVRIFLSTYRPR